MKRMKKLMCLMLSLVLALGMGITAMAAPGDAAAATCKITVPNTDDHTYEVYQIFTGDYAKDGNDKVLSNVKWGANGTGTVGEAVSEAVLNALKDAAAKGGSDSELLKVITPNFKSGTTPIATVGKGGSVDVPTGYYLIKDADATLGDDDEHTLYIVQVVGDVTITRKADKPTVEKKVKENSDKVKDDTYGEGYNDVADYSIGDTVPFELIGSVSSEYDEYTTPYYYSFEDTLSSGLSFKDGTLHVYKATWSNDKLVLGDEITNYFGITTSEHSVKVTIDNLKNAVPKYYEGMRIVVKYDAVLNKNAVVGKGGNLNEVTLEFSNNPNSGGEGDKGKTPEDKVIVFTYELDTTKVDGSNQNTKLEGAEFKLQNSEGKWLQVYEEGEDKDKVKAWVDNEDDASTLISGADGLFKVIGLDDGTYYLKETKAPEKYNILEKPITLVIKGETANGQDVADLSGALTDVSVKADDKAEEKGDVTTGIVGTSVINNKGSLLPETGGIGTTIFYVLGSIMVLGCGVILVTRKRMSKSN